MSGQFIMRLMSKLANKHTNTPFPFLFSPLLNLGEFSRKRKGGLPLKMHLGNFVRNLPFYFAFFLENQVKNLLKISGGYSFTNLL